MSKLSARNRNEALSQGAATYQGAQCERGHSERYTSNRACVECAKAARRAAYDTETATMEKRAYRSKRKAASEALGTDMLDDL